MYYLTDNPWPAVIVLGGLAVACLVSGNAVVQRLAVVLGLCAAAVYGTAQMVVSTAESIEVSAAEVLAGFQQEDLNQIGRWISSGSPDLMETAEKGLRLVEIQPGFHIRSVELKSESDSEAVVRIRANGNIKERTHSMTQRTAEYWETTWVRENDTWKLAKAVRLNPINGQPRGTFDRS